MQRPRTAHRNAWGLTVLALLYEKPMHPYEMQRMIRERGKDQLVNLKRGSLYHAIERLEAAGMIDPVETSREGRRPERTVYKITDLGREELEEWLRELLSRPAPDYPQFVAALNYLPILLPEDALRQLEARLVLLESEVAGFDAAIRSTESYLHRLWLLEVDYARAVRKAELDWVRAIVEDLRSGELTWNHDKLRELAKQFEGSTEGGGAVG
jgi:DNA-binding PadR family transcriptional regulator